MHHPLKTTVENHLERIASRLRQNSAMPYGCVEIEDLSVLWHATMSPFGMSIVKFDVRVVSTNEAPVFQGVYISE